MSNRSGKLNPEMARTDEGDYVLRLRTSSGNIITEATMESIFAFIAESPELRSRFANLVDGNVFTGVQDFSSATVTGFSTLSALTEAGAWVTSHVYSVGAIVTHATERYACVVAHTSDVFATDLSGSKWVLLDAVLALAASNNLSDLISASTARTNLGLGSSAVMSPTQIASDPALTSTYVQIVDRPISFTQPSIGGSASASDNTTAWNNAMTILAASGGEMFVPPGVYAFTGTTSPIPGTARVYAGGFNYSHGSGAAPTLGAVLKATAAMARLVQLGTNPATSAETDAAAKLYGITIDGNSLAVDAVRTSGRRDRIEGCAIIGGTTNGVNIAGQNSWIVGSKVSGAAAGTPVYISSQNDHKIYDNEIRQSATDKACIMVRDASKVIISGNHLWQGSNGVSAAGSLIWIEAASADVDGIIITGGNTIEGTLSSKLYILSGSGRVLRNIQVTCNDVYEPTAITDNTLSILKLDGAGAISGVNFANNTVLGFDPSHRFKAAVESIGAGTRTKIIVGMNNLSNVATAWTGFTPANGIGNALYNGSATVNTSGAGKSTQSGTGSATAFTIAHALSATPSSVRVTPGSAAAAAAFYVTADATNITVTFTAAPASGTNNVVLNWSAEV